MIIPGQVKPIIIERKESRVLDVTIGVEPSAPKGYGKCYNSNDCSGRPQKGKSDFHNCMTKYGGKSICIEGMCYRKNGSVAGSC
jgi:hypothetical protein